MPIVTVKVLAGVFDQATQERMVDALTDAMCAVGGEGMRPSVHVLVEEVGSGRWGIGGEKLRTETLLARRAARTRKA
jgi:4-oxalocrotonate tautomerase